MGRPFVIAVTGGMGAGKSTVAALMARRGALLLDADAHARRALEDAGVREAIVGRFGPRVLTTDGTIDRQALARAAFASPEGTAFLNGAVHPAVTDTLLSRLAGIAGGPGSSAFVVLDIPLLTAVPEVVSRCDAVVAVEAPLEERLARLDAGGFERADAEARIAAQPSDDERRGIATDILRNDGTTAELERAVEALWAQLERRAALPR
jgi:dephospho-CoA kinase